MARRVIDSGHVARFNRQLSQILTKSRVGGVWRNPAVRLGGIQPCGGHNCYKPHSSLR
jgi:hypothetical protein